MSGQYAELVEKRIPAAIERITSGLAPMRIPVDNTDPDIVLAEAASALTTLTQQQSVLYKSCSKHEGMPYKFTATTQPYYKIICPQCDPPKNQMGDSTVPVANGGASTTASRLSNKELAEAIERAQALTRNTATGEVIYKAWVAHLEALLAAQRTRAQVDRTAPETSTRSADE